MHLLITKQIILQTSITIMFVIIICLLGISSVSKECYATTPVINSITLPSEINLNAGTTKEIECRANVTDADNDLYYANATLYDNIHSRSGDDDDNNKHYTNKTCSISGNSPYIVSCNFSIMYYANPSSWTCNITVGDGTDSVSRYNTSTLNELKAITVTSIEYHDGNHNSISLGNNSQIAQMNITNIGNINVSIEVSGSNFTCESGTINVSNQIFNLSSTFEQGTKLTHTPKDSKLDVSKQISSISIGHIYWMLYIPKTSVGGNCFATIKVDAI